MLIGASTLRKHGYDVHKSTFPSQVAEGLEWRSNQSLSKKKKVLLLVDTTSSIPNVDINSPTTAAAEAKEPTPTATSGTSTVNGSSSTTTANTSGIFSLPDLVRHVREFNPGQRTATDKVMPDRELRGLVSLAN